MENGEGNATEEISVPPVLMGGKREVAQEAGEGKGLPPRIH